MFICRLSMAFTGEVLLFRPRDVKEESSRPACSLDEDRNRAAEIWLAGGGAKDAAVVILGEALADDE